MHRCPRFVRSREFEVADDLMGTLVGQCELRQGQRVGGEALSLGDHAPLSAGMATPMMHLGGERRGESERRVGSVSLILSIT
jgi:hypothetical protein